MASRALLAVAAVLAPGCAAVNLRSGADQQAHMVAREVALGDFSSVGDACDYCYASYTREGKSPAGPVAPHCVCMSYPAGAAHKAFCATPVSATGWVKDQGGCLCNPRDMEAMGKTTCKKME
mmetsp:Transcript_113065/g.315946  ORF Transcript_113065/g.315946 Transcript_113065/m.315946 type:complete len:122 (-) Transcript_113065:118-483(-)